MDEYTNAWDNGASGAHMYGVLRDRERRSLKRQSIRAGICVAAFLLLQRGLSRLLFSSSTLYGLYLNSETAHELIEMFFYLLCMLVPFVIAHLTMRQEDRDTLTLFQAPASKLTAVTAVVLGFLVCNAANYLTSLLLSALEDAGVFADGGTYDSPTTAVQLVYSILTIGLLPAFVEEFALRGIVMQPLRRHGDKRPFIGVACVGKHVVAKLPVVGVALAVVAACGAAVGAAHGAAKRSHGAADADLFFDPALNLGDQRLVFLSADHIGARLETCIGFALRGGACAVGFHPGGKHTRRLLFAFAAMVKQPGFAFEQFRKLFERFGCETFELAVHFVVTQRQCEKIHVVLRHRFAGVLIDLFEFLFDIKCHACLLRSRV